MGLLLLLADAAHAAPRHLPDTETAGLVVGFVGIGATLGLAMLAVSLIIRRDGTRIGGVILGYPLPIGLTLGALARLAWGASGYDRGVIVGQLLVAGCFLILAVARSVRRSRR